MKFVMTKDGITPIENQACFCDGPIHKSQSCGLHFKRILKQVEFENEGGPFGTSIRKLVEFLKKYRDHPDLFKMDRVKIEKAIAEYDEEVAKVSCPIEEKFEKVEKRVVNAELGNPSDKRYKDAIAMREEKKLEIIPEERKEGQHGGQASKNFKLNVVSNRNPPNVEVPKAATPSSSTGITITTLQKDALDYLDEIF